MHLCFPIDAVCTICREPEAVHDVKHSGKLDLTSLRKNDYISDVIEPNADEDNLSPILNAFVDSEEFSAAWFLLSSNNVSSSQLRLQLPCTLLAESPLTALLLSDVCYFKAKAIVSSSVSKEELRVGDSFVAIALYAPFGMSLLVQDFMEVLPVSDYWSYVVDTVAPEVYSQVLSATSSKEMEMRCVENKICGDGPKCSKSPAKSYFQDAPAKMSSSSLPPWDTRHGALLSWRYWDSPSLLPC